MGAGSIGGKNYCGNLLWQSSLTLLPLLPQSDPVAPDAPEKLCFGGKPHEVRPEGPQGAAREHIVLLDKMA